MVKAILISLLRNIQCRDADSVADLHARTILRVEFSECSALLHRNPPLVARARYKSPLHCTTEDSGQKTRGE
jgi:hypothetical protein